MNHLSMSVRDILEAFHSGKPEVLRAAWENLAKDIQPTRSNGFATQHLVTYQYFSDPEQASIRKDILDLLQHIYCDEHASLPTQQKSSLQKASNNWNITVWYLFLAFGPDLLRSREACMHIVRLSKQAQFDFDTCVSQVHARRRERLSRISKSTSLATAAKLKPADIFSVELPPKKAAETSNASKKNMPLSPILGEKASRARDNMRPPR